MTEEQQVIKIIPSPFERKFDQLAAKLIPLIPQWIKPNLITVVGFLIGMFAALSYYLASFHKIWLLIAASAVLLHLLADSLDGSLARERSLTSKRGEFLDQILDAIFFAALPIGIGFSSYAIFEIIIFSGILADLHNFLIMLWIVLREKWLFPGIGVFEYHLIFIVGAILSYFWYGSVLTLGNYSLGCFDIIVLIAVPLSFIDFCISAFKLFQELENL